MNDLGVVIVTYNSESSIPYCLESVYKYIGPSTPIVVVDNHSVDDTLAEIKPFHQVKVIVNRRNLGFAAACNQGVAALDRPFLLLLNPDIRLRTRCEELRALCRGTVVAATGKLVNQDGTLQSGFHLRRLPTPWTLVFELLGFNRMWRRNPINWRYRMQDCDPEQPGLVEQPAAAFFLMARQAWLELGGMDDRFAPIWFEDVDLCKRIARRGWQIAYEPAVRATHLGGHSIRLLTPARRIGFWYRSLLRYSALWFTRRQHAMVSLAASIAVVLRAGLALVLGRYAQSSAYINVFTTIWYHREVALTSRRQHGTPVLTKTEG